MPDREFSEEYDEFWQELLIEAEASGDPQQASFFQIYSSLAAENGDCADLVYTPVRQEGVRGFQIDGFSVDRDRGELHVAVCDFRADRELQTLNADRMEQLFRRVKRFCERAVDQEFILALEQTSPAFEAANQIYVNRGVIKRIRCVVFSNARLATRKKSVEAEEVNGNQITFSVIDFTRYIDIQKAQGGVESIELDVKELNGKPLECLSAHVGDNEYEAYLVVVPGELLARIYGLYGARLMEQNVRTFLQARTKANKGIIATATENPEMFFAYNNGITATATAVGIEETEDGRLGINTLSDLQIVNGGQTTASLLYARDQNKADLSRVFVQMKLSVVSPDRVEEVVPLISRYANTQNRISEADFFSSHPFHVEMQQISRRLTAPIAEGSLSATRWFYERARGQYRNELASRKPAAKRRFETEFPRSQLIQKTELAKYHLTFRGLPHIVSLGAQKAFLTYAQEIGKKWDKKAEIFNDDFFRSTVSKAIVFRWVDSMVGKSEWYKQDRGYKANIVTYTIAWLVNHLEKAHSAKINLEQIWKLQSLPDALQRAFIDLAPKVAGLLKNPQQGVMINVSEYAKQQGCWAAISKEELLTADPSLLACTLSQEEAREQTKGHAKIKAIDNEIEFETRLFALIEKAPDIEVVAGQKRLLSSLSKKALGKLANGNISLTKSETNSLKHLFSRLADSGYDVMDSV